MRSTNILAMTNPLVLLTPRRERRQPAARVERGSTRGRAWINGREAGGTEARFAHLRGGYD
jgi:hypothetical protein